MGRRGFCGVGAFLDVDIPEVITKHKSMVFTFGPTGSFGYCSAAPESQRKLGWWSNWGTLGVPDGNVVDSEEIRTQLRQRHGTWKDPVIQHIIENMTTDRIYPIWTTPDLPHWGQRGALLIGDAAHTLPATSGNGAGQALEDSVTFSLLLSHYINKVDSPGDSFTLQEAIELSSKGLYEIRHPRVATIRARSRNLYLTNRKIDSIIIEYFYYCFIYIWTHFPMLSTLLYKAMQLALLSRVPRLIISGRLFVGSVFTSLDERGVEERVEEYLTRKGL